MMFRRVVCAFLSGSSRLPEPDDCNGKTLPNRSQCREKTTKKIYFFNRNHKMGERILTGNLIFLGFIDRGRETMVC